MSILQSMSNFRYTLRKAETSETYYTVSPAIFNEQLQPSSIS